MRKKKRKEGLTIVRPDEGVDSSLSSFSISNIILRLLYRRVEGRVGPSLESRTQVETSSFEHGCLDVSFSFLPSSAADSISYLFESSPPNHHNLFSSPSFVLSSSLSQDVFPSTLPPSFTSVGSAGSSFLRYSSSSSLRAPRQVPPRPTLPSFLLP